MGWIDRFAALGVQGVTLCDTTGMAYPTQAQALHERSAPAETGIHRALSRHAAMGGVNAIAAIEAGIRRFDMSLGGIGGCPYAPGASGNVATEDIVHMLDCMGYDTGVDVQGLIDAAQVLEELVRHPLPSQVASAGVRLKRHLPPLDFDQIVERAHGRGSAPSQGAA